MAYNIWDILGIPPTSDKKAIKKAYARQSSSCHPEEHPEEFERLYNAYKMALKIAAVRQAAQARSGAVSETVTEPVSESDSPKQPAFSRGTGDHSGGSAAHEPPAETDDRETEHRSHPQEFTHKPDPMVIPSISQLVEHGMEQEKRAAVRKLMAKLRALHSSFPKTVNSRGDELSEALEQLENLFHSQWFMTAGWDPDFLRLLDQWLRRNQDTVNRAETVALSRAYHFEKFQTPDYPSSPHISNIYRDVMRLSIRYEKDMIALAGIKPIAKAPAPPPRTDRPLFRWGVDLRLLILAVFLIHLAMSCSSSGPQPTPSSYDMEKIMSGIEREAANQPNTLTVPGMPSQAEAGQSEDESSHAWKYHRYYQVDRPESTPFSPEEYEYNGKNQLTLSYSKKDLDSSGDRYSSFSALTLVVRKISDWKIHVSNSFLNEGEKAGSIVIYNMETYDEEPISFKMWVVPGESDNGPAACWIGGCGYWAEAFLHFASKAGIEGRTWYDQDYNAHLVLTCSSIQNIQDFTERLLKASSWYSDYVSGFSPPLDLAIIYGPDIGEALDQLQSLEKPGKDPSSLITLTETEQMERCGPDPRPRPDGDSGLVSLASFDENLRWISWAHIEENSTDPLAFYPDLPPDEAVQRVAADLNGLDWVLSRFEIKDGMPVSP